MVRELEEVIVFHCAPSIVGIKPSNLISCSIKKYPDLIEKVDEYNKSFNKSDIYFDLICICERRYLILVYRKEVLKKQLCKIENKKYLTKIGYPVNKGFDAILDHLKSQLYKTDFFPHEIGLFLGYPLEDVLGFMAHEGKNYKTCGYWKVYSDVEKAENLFKNYDKCCKAFCAKLKKGKSIAQIFSVA